MQLFYPRHSVVRDLGRKMRVLLPSDPGRERMIELMRLFNPAARAASAGRVCADSRHIFLTKPLAIDADTASRAQTPPGLSTVYFVQIAVASARLTPSAIAQGEKELKETATLLIGGLAARLGGKAFPESARLREPLHADVYSPRALTAGELSAVLEPYAPGLAPAEGPWTADGVTTLHSQRGQLDVEYWPPGVPLMTMDPPAALGGLRDQRQQLNVTVIRSARPAAGADPGTARAVAGAGLAVAAATGGSCVDIFGFRFEHPDDLIIR
jgi:hypothetical protein